MDKWLAPLISAGSSLLGGIFKNDAAQSAAQRATDIQNFQAQGGNLDAYLYNVRKAADAHGFSPLAVMGQGAAMGSAPVADVGDSGIGAAGQDVGRAVAAATEQPSRADQLNEQLVEAKIANVNADTVRLQAIASGIATKLGQPGTANVPMPPEDPRGPVIALMQRARDHRTGEVVWIPSEKAASPLQTLAASPTNLALSGRALTEGLLGFPGPVSGQAARSSSSAQFEPYSTWLGVP